MPFPGFDTSTGFRSTLIFDSRLERPLSDRALKNLASLNPARAVRSAVDLYMEELSVLNEEPGCDVVLVARPDQLPEGGQEAEPRRGWRARGKAPVAEDFRAQLKAEAMRHSHPLQLIRRATWDPSYRPPDDKERSLQDEATGHGTFTPPESATAQSAPPTSNSPSSDEQQQGACQVNRHLQTTCKPDAEWH